MRRGRRWEEETRSKYIKKIDICRELIKDCYLKNTWKLYRSNSAKHLKPP